MTIRKNMSIYDYLINRFNMAKKLPPINSPNSVQSIEYVLKRFKKNKKDNLNDLRDFINFFGKEENIKNAINLVIDYTTNMILGATTKADLINFMASTKNINVFLSTLSKQNKDINIRKATQIIEEKEKIDKLKADLRYGHYQIKNNPQNEWNKLPTCGRHPSGIVLLMILKNAKKIILMN